MPDKEKPTIGMLLDIEHLYGEHEGRLTPWMLAIALPGIPLLFYVYLGAFEVIPIWVAAIICVFLLIRGIMLFPGRESYRMEIFRKQLHDQYTSTATLMNIKTIYPDGCIEYINGRIMYMVCCFNGTSDDEVVRSVQLRKLLDAMFGDFEVDVYIHNLNDSPALREYYNNVSAFEHNTSAKNFISMIDHTLTITEDSSVVQCTIYCIKGTRSDWKQIKSQIDSAVGSRSARCYKKIYRVEDPDAINEVLNRNIDSIINITELLRKKYATQNYDTSKVLAYDLPEDKEIIQGKSTLKPIIPEQTKSSFHVKYKERS